MSAKPIFRGTATALVTPMTPEGVDYDSMGKLIDFQIEQGIKGLIVCATTGEAPTLSDEEHLETLAFAVERAAGKVPVIAGTGSNYTDHAVMMTKEACRLGVDGILAVSPYYNKTNQNGLIRNFSVIADASEKLVIIYNVPSRTSVNIEASTCKALSRHGNIVAVKEASGNISQVAEIASLVGDDMVIYSGNDDQIVPLLALGGQGVISVVSNVLPAETVRLCEAWFEGAVEESKDIQLKLFPLIKALFSQVSPTPVKAALQRMGYCSDYVRLPLIPLEEPYRAKLYAVMETLGI